MPWPRPWSTLNSPGARSAERQRAISPLRHAREALRRRERAHDLVGAALVAGVATALVLWLPVA